MRSKGVPLVIEIPAKNFKRNVISYEDVASEAPSSPTHLRAILDVISEPKEEREVEERWAEEGELIIPEEDEELYSALSRANSIPLPPFLNHSMMTVRKPKKFYI